MTGPSTVAWPTSSDRGRTSQQAVAAARRPAAADVSGFALDQFQRLIGDIYDAALDPSRWNAVLMRAQSFVGGPAAVVFGVFRGEQPDLLDAGTRSRLRMIAPHIRRAVQIAQTIEGKDAEAATFADVFDSLSIGVFFVDAAGRIVHANAGGQALLARGSPLRVAGGKLVANGTDAARALTEMFAAVGQGADLKSIAVPLTAQDGEHYTAHVLPLSSGAARPHGVNAAVATVFVRKATVAAPSLPDVIAQHFKLTAAELRVLLAVAQVGGVAETADVLGIGEATVKTHLHRVFGKTGTSRQAELVRLVAGFANPLLS